MRKSLFVALLSVVLLVMSFFVTNFPEYELPIVASLCIVLFALPSFSILVRTDVKKGLFAIVSLGLFALFIESVGVLTGFPYSAFSYSEGMGFKLGLVPWTVFFSWPPLIIGVWSFTKKYWSKFALVLAPVFLVFADVVIDPVNTALGFWVWAKDGLFYGVPLMNFFGWLVSGFIGAVIIRFFFPNGFSTLASLSLFIFVLFATLASFWLMLWIPFLVGLAFLIFLFLVLPKDIVLFDKKI